MSDVVAKVEELAGLLDQHHLTSIRIKDGDVSIELRRDPEPTTQVHHAVAAVGSANGTGEGTAIPSPMVGVFYGRPSPTEDPFVSPGDRVSVGQVIGVIEAMKVFNEVESPISGVIARIVAEDGQVVQQGDTLFVIES